MRNQPRLSGLVFFVSYAEIMTILCWRRCFVVLMNWD